MIRRNFIKVTAFFIALASAGFASPPVLAAYTIMRCAPTASC